MLVISRKRNEAVRIGDVEVRVIETSRGRAKLGIDAPRDVHIRREEVRVIAADTENVTETGEQRMSATQVPETIGGTIPHETITDAMREDGFLPPKPPIADHA